MSVVNQTGNAFVVDTVSFLNNGSERNKNGNHEDLRFKSGGCNGLFRCIQ